MSKKPGKHAAAQGSGTDRGRSARRLTWSLVVVPAALVGCAGLGGSRPAGDPLVGGGPAIPKGQAAADNGTAAAPQAPPPPAPVFTAPTNAALASRTGLQGDDRADLRINENRGTGGWARQGQPAAGGGSAPSSAARLNRIDGGPDPVPGNSGSRMDTSVVPALSGGVGTYEEALSRLQERGVIWHRLEQTGDGDWRFTCSVPSRTNPNARRTHEAHDRNYLNALRAVLDKIEREQ